MTHKALIRQLQISCLGLDAVDPLRLLVDDVIAALRENALKEVQRLGQEIEQEPVIDKSAAIRIATSLGWSPQRTWQGLTDEDKKQMFKEANYHWEMTAGEYAERICQLTEAKLKDKNSA